MIRRPPRSTQSRSSAASDVYKRQSLILAIIKLIEDKMNAQHDIDIGVQAIILVENSIRYISVSYTHLRAHETVLDLVCRLLLEKKKKKKTTENNRTKTINNTYR